LTNAALRSYERLQVVDPFLIEGTSSRSFPRSLLCLISFFFYFLSSGMDIFGNLLRTIGSHAALSKLVYIAVEWFPNLPETWCLGTPLSLVSLSLHEEGQREREGGRKRGRCVFTFLFFLASVLADMSGKRSQALKLASKVFLSSRFV